MWKRIINCLIFTMQMYEITCPLVKTARYFTSYVRKMSLKNPKNYSWFSNNKLRTLVLISWVQKLCPVKITEIDEEVNSNLKLRNIFQNAPIYSMKNP